MSPKYEHFDNDPYIRNSYIYIILPQHLNFHYFSLFMTKIDSYIYIILPQHLNFHYFSLFMTKIHTTVVKTLTSDLVYHQVFIELGITTFYYPGQQKEY
jgi:hypothetical protein